MTKNLIIIALVILIIYLYYQQQQKPAFWTGSSASEDTIRDLQTQLQQAQQLETCNSEKLTNYETKVQRLATQLQTYQSEENWETKTAQVIKGLETEVSDLTTERDEAVRDKRTTEQENLSLGNKLKLKNQEADNKSKEIERLKKEKSQSEIALNKSLTEWKEKYRKQGKLLDEEQLECKKLEETNEKLTEKIAELTKPKPKLPGEWDYEAELTKELKEKEQKIAELEKQLKIKNFEDVD